MCSRICAKVYGVRVYVSSMEARAQCVDELRERGVWTSESWGKAAGKFRRSRGGEGVCGCWLVVWVVLAEDRRTW